MRAVAIVSPGCDVSTNSVFEITSPRRTIRLTRAKATASGSSKITLRLCLLAASFLLTPHIPLAIAGVPAAQTGGSWQELGDLNIGRFGCKAHSIDGHRAIVIAGWGDDLDSGADNSAEILETNTGRWTATSSMPPGFSPGAIPWTAKLSADYYLVAGGLNAFGSGDLASYIYSVSKNSWTRVGDLPQGATLVSNFSQTDAIVLDDGRVLVAGGLTFGVGESSASMVFTPNLANLSNGLSGDSAGTWDFTRDSDGQITQINGPAEHHKLIKLKDGRVLLIVGEDRRFRNGRWGYVYRDTLGVQAELFDPSSGIWTPLPNLPAIPGEDDRHSGVQGVRQQAAVALLADGRVLVAGGVSEPADERGRPLLRDLYYVRSSAVLFDPSRYDAGQNPWSITGAMQVGRESQQIGNLPGSAGIISVWGWTRNGATATAEIYDEKLGKWKTAASLPALPNSSEPVSQPWGCSTMMPGGQMLIIGGAWDAVLNRTSRRTYLYKP